MHSTGVCCAISGLERNLRIQRVPNAISSGASSQIAGNIGFFLSNILLPVIQATRAHCTL